MSPSDFGVAAGQPVADASAVLPADGRVRMYVFAQGRGVVSAVSVATDGASFIPEVGNRLPDGSGMPRAIVHPSGGWRLFFISGGGIRSAVSTDGLTLTVESGFRVTEQEAGFTGTHAGTASGATVIRLAGAGAPILTESSEHPFALANADGSVTVYYGRFGGAGTGGEGIYHSTSADRLTFETETFDLFFGNDPDVIRLTDGSLVMYFGQFDPQTGGTINLARCPDPVH